MHCFDRVSLMRLREFVMTRVMTAISHELLSYSYIATSKKFTSRPIAINKLALANIYRTWSISGRRVSIHLAQSRGP